MIDTPWLGTLMLIPNTKSSVKWKAVKMIHFGGSSYHSWVSRKCLEILKLHQFSKRSYVLCSLHSLILWNISQILLATNKCLFPYWRNYHALRTLYSSWTTILVSSMWDGAGPMIWISLWAISPYMRVQWSLRSTMDWSRQVLWWTYGTYYFQTL